MKKDFTVGDHMSWNSEAGHVRETIKRKVTTVITVKEEPQYVIKSDKTDHLAMHKGAALTTINKSHRSSQER